MRQVQIAPDAMVNFRQAQIRAIEVRLDGSDQHGVAGTLMDKRPIRSQIGRHKVVKRRLFPGGACETAAGRVTGETVDQAGKGRFKVAGIIFSDVRHLFIQIDRECIIQW
jgi:hypothetical protein